MNVSRKRAQLKENAEGVIALSAEHGLTDSLALAATSLRGWAMAAQGRCEEGIAQIQEGLATLHTMGARLPRPYFLCLLAEAYKETGRLDDGLSALTEALAVVEERPIRTTQRITFSRRA
jgi:predicted ATPase